MLLNLHIATYFLPSFGGIFSSFQPVLQPTQVCEHTFIKVIYSINIDIALSLIIKIYDIYYTVYAIDLQVLLLPLRSPSST